MRHVPVHVHAEILGDVVYSARAHYVRWRQTGGSHAVLEIHVVQYALFAVLFDGLVLQELHDVNTSFGADLLKHTSIRHLTVTNDNKLRFIGTNAHLLVHIYTIFVIYCTSKLHEFQWSKCKTFLWNRLHNYACLLRT